MDELDSQRGVPMVGRVVFRVRYVECDPMGFMHHSHFLPMLEMGRTELLRSAGISYRELEERDVLFAVTKILVNFKRPPRYDDSLELITRITHGRRMCGSSMLGEMFNQATRELLCTADSTIACINRRVEVREIPDFLKAAKT